MARAAARAARLYRLTGQWVDGRYLLPMFGRIARDDPARAAATATIASAKDYLFAWLTGELATDPSTASGYGCYALEAGDWADGAFPARDAAAESDEARARRWDNLWAAHESARSRLHPPTGQPGGLP